jgi:hypothetical protein
MRITCTSTPEGSVYRFYRTELGVTAALKPLVPFLLASQADVLVGRQDDDPDLLLCVGPIGGDAEKMLLGIMGRFVVGYPVTEPPAPATTFPA